MELLLRECVSSIARSICYIYNRQTNTEKVKVQLVELSAFRDQVQLQVDAAIDEGDKIYEDVRNWLKHVDAVIKDGNQLLQREGDSKMDFLHGFCPNIKLRYELGKKSIKLLQRSIELYAQREFPDISYKVENVHVMPNVDYEAFDSRILTVKKIVAELRNPNTNRIGVYGLSGVGKTTLIKELCRKVKDQNLFEEVVILYDISSSLEFIQTEIAEQLGLDNAQNGTRYGQARRLCDRMKNTKILLILDDVGQSIDLEAVGIPNVATCKVLFISRNREVLSSYQIRTERDFQLHVLNGGETWSLFEKTAGDVVKDPAIQAIAMQIARKCGGLPLLAVTLASNLKGASLERWGETLRCLMRYDVNDQLIGRGYSGIEWSYIQMEEERLKSLFVLCGIIAWRNYISLDDLLKYSMGLGRFKELSTIQAQNSLYSMVEQLKDRCLLLDGGSNDFVKIDDVVLDFAISVAVRGQQLFPQAYAEELGEGPDDNFLKKCTSVSLPCCNIPRLPIVLDCPEMRLFHSWSNDGSSEISWSFLEKMKNLKVLGLTNFRILLLPSSLRFIRKLHTLCLHGCELDDLALIGQLTSLQVLSFARSKVKHLPEEIGHLSCLRVLDLNDCTELVVIFPNVLSRLTSLEELRMKNSFDKWETEGGIAERSNACLSELQDLSQLSTLAIHIRDVGILPEGLFTSKKLENYQILIGGEWKWEDVDASINRLLKLKLTASSQLAHQGLRLLLRKSDNLYLNALKNCKTTVHESDDEDFQLKHLVVQNYAKIEHILNEKVLLLNLTSLIVHGCDGLDFLLSSSMTKSFVQLKYLHISKCQMMEEIVHAEEHIDILHNLEHLQLTDLPNLARFCSEIYEEIEDGDSRQNLDTVVNCVLFGRKVGFPRMQRLTVNGLPKLTTLWHHQLSPDSFGRLRDIRVQRCDGLVFLFVPNIQVTFNALSTLDIKSCARLQYVFTASVTKDLQLLAELKVEDCRVLEAIIAKEEGLETSRPKFFFPELTTVKFQNLPQLKSLYPDLHDSKWPLLKTLEMRECNQVKIFAVDVSTYQELTPPIKQAFYLIQKDSFPSMKHLTLGAMDMWYSSSGPAKFFSKLKSLEICSTTSCKQPVVLRRCGTLPNLQRLRLKGVEELRHQWKKSCLPAGPVSGNFEVLQVTFCGMKNLELSSVSFETLKVLEVTYCWGLKYLMTHSIAKSLVHLTKLKVDECKSMIEIVSSDGDGDDEAEIVFERLQHLELCDLISLQRFCSPSCRVRFQSSLNLQVNHCPVDLRVSPDWELLVGEEDVQHQIEAINENSNTEDIVQRDSESREAAETIDSLSLKTNQNQAGRITSGEAQGTEFSAGELHNEGPVSQLNNGRPVLPGIPDSMQLTLTEPSNLVTNEAKQVQLQDNLAASGLTLCRPRRSAATTTATSSSSAAGGSSSNIQPPATNARRATVMTTEATVTVVPESTGQSSILETQPSSAPIARLGSGIPGGSEMQTLRVEDLHVHNQPEIVEVDLIPDSLVQIAEVRVEIPVSEVVADEVPASQIIGPEVVAETTQRITTEEEEALAHTADGAPNATPAPQAILNQPPEQQVTSATASVSEALADQVSGIDGINETAQTAAPREEEIPVHESMDVEMPAQAFESGETEAQAQMTITAEEVGQAAANSPNALSAVQEENTPSTSDQAIRQEPSAPISAQLALDTQPSIAFDALPSFEEDPLLRLPIVREPSPFADETWKYIRNLGGLEFGNREVASKVQATVSALLDNLDDLPPSARPVARELLQEVLQTLADLRKDHDAYLNKDSQFEDSAKMHCETVDNYKKLATSVVQEDDKKITELEMQKAELNRQIALVQERKLGKLLAITNVRARLKQLHQTTDEVATAKTELLRLLENRSARIGKIGLSLYELRTLPPE